MKYIRLVFALCKNFIPQLIYRGEIKFLSIDTSSLVALDGIPVTVTWSVQNAIFVRISTASTLFLPSDSTIIMAKPTVGAIYLQAYGLFTHKRIRIPLIRSGIKLKAAEQKIKFNHLSDTQQSSMNTALRFGRKQRIGPLLKPLYRKRPINRTLFIQNTIFNLPKLFSPKMQSPDSYHKFKNDYPTRSLGLIVPPSKTNPHEC